MIRSALVRRVVTGLSVVMLLLCQTMAAALTYAAAPSPVSVSVQTAAIDAPAPCQTADNDNPSPDNCCQNRCLSRDATFETAKTHIPAAAGVAMSPFTVVPSDCATALIARYEQIVARAAPPPLRLVYCRLLN